MMFLFPITPWTLLTIFLKKVDYLIYSSLSTKPSTSFSSSSRYFPLLVKDYFDFDLSSLSRSDFFRVLLVVSHYLSPFPISSSLALEPFFLVCSFFFSCWFFKNLSRGDKEGSSSSSVVPPSGVSVPSTVSTSTSYVFSTSLSSSFFAFPIFFPPKADITFCLAFSAAT